MTKPDLPQLLARVEVIRDTYASDNQWASEGQLTASELIAAIDALRAENERLREETEPNYRERALLAEQQVVWEREAAKQAGAAGFAVSADLERCRALLARAEEALRRRNREGTYV